MWLTAAAVVVGRGVGAAFGDAFAELRQRLRQLGLGDSRVVAVAVVGNGRVVRRGCVMGGKRIDGEVVELRGLGRKMGEAVAVVGRTRR